MYKDFNFFLFNDVKHFIEDFLACIISQPDFLEISLINNLIFITNLQMRPGFINHEMLFITNRVSLKSDLRILQLKFWIPY